jgi:hypothetical protein
MLPGQHSTAWAIPPAHFALVILEIGSFFMPQQVWTIVFQFMHPAKMIGMLNHTQLLVEIGSCEVLWKLAWNLPISVSQVDGIKGMSHWYPAPQFNFNFTKSVRHNCQVFKLKLVIFLTNTSFQREYLFLTWQFPNPEPGILKKELLL